MNNNSKDTSIINHMYYFFDDFINIKDFNSNNIKIDEVIQKNSNLLYWLCDDQIFEIHKN